MWKYGVSPYHNNTDKNWITVKDSTWTDIISPLGKKLSKGKGAVANCRPGARKLLLKTELQIFMRQALAMLFVQHHHTLMSSVTLQQCDALSPRSAPRYILLPQLFHTF